MYGYVKPTFVFCCKPVDPNCNSPYCTEHYEIAYHLEDKPKRKLVEGNEAEKKSRKRPIKFEIKPELYSVVIEVD